MTERPPGLPCNPSPAPAAEAGPRRGTEPAPNANPDTPVAFKAVLAAELKQINLRRARNGRPVVLPDGPQAGDLVGLSLSGGGIRSAAVCLGAIQALRSELRLHNVDYLSTVSGGGYTGACLNASMSAKGGYRYPFGDDVDDSPVVAHLRNFSNYLLPRDRSGTRNWLEAIAVVLRGLLANAVCVLAFMLPVVMLLVVAFPQVPALADANVLQRFFEGLAAIGAGNWGAAPGDGATHSLPMTIPLILSAALAATLVAWAMLKSLSSFDALTNDTRSFLLRISYGLLLAALVAALIDVQPLLMAGAFRAASIFHDRDRLVSLFSGLGAAVTFISTFAGRLASFVERSGRSKRRSVFALGIFSRTLLFVGAMLLPALIWLSGAVLYRWVLAGGAFSPSIALSHLPRTRFELVAAAWLVTVVITFCLRANNYSLHWFYRDRLSAAFLVGPGRDPAGGGEGSPDPPIASLNKLKLSDLKDSVGPYPIVNCALNLQGSLEANKRGRNADFFIFTPEFVGSALTHYVTASAIERIDPRVDIGAAMAISGAAASANMGSSTVRILSPTLSLMNVRLGYYLKNPLYMGEEPTFAHRVEGLVQRLRDQFFILIEMVNGLNEHRRTIYLSDGGHIENLGLYELLKRRCAFIVAIDAEADPELGFGSLLKLERYARIDLGTRIALPWEAIASQSRKASNALSDGRADCENGPHAAIGRIIYPDGPGGLLLYVKSSLTGDERDYILDYARRNPTFPHEATSDQFFSEEQLEMYRALGFHMVQGLFTRDRISFVQGDDGFADETAARKAMEDHLPAARP